MKCPPESPVEFFSAWFSYIVQQGSPPKPQVVGMGGQFVEHGEGVVEIVLMSHPIFGLGTFQRQQFGKNKFQQTCFLEQYKTDRRFGRKHDFIQFVGYPFFGDNIYPFLVAGDGIERVIFEVKS